ADAPRRVVAAYREHAQGKRAIFFTPTVEVSKAMVKAFGRGAEHLDGGTPLREREAILARFKTGKTTIVSNCAVLGEGFDQPMIEAVIIARPTLSPILYAQMIGRGLRLPPDYPTKGCVIIDTVGASSRHNILNAASFFGVKPEALAQEGGLQHAIR